MEKLISFILTAIIIWIFVYRKIHTYVLNKIHSDNIAVVLPLVTWLTHVLSACDVTCFTFSRKTAKRWRVEDSKYAYTGLQEHGRSLHRGLENGSLPVGSRGRYPGGLGTQHKSSKNPKTDAGYTRCQRGGNGRDRDVTVETREGGGGGSLSYPSWLWSLNWERRELYQRGLGQSHTRKWFVEYAVSCNFTRFSVFWKLAVSDNDTKIAKRRKLKIKLGLV